MEAQHVNRYKRKILSLLLKKYERSQSFQAGAPGKQRPQMTLTGSELTKDYHDEMDYRKREWIHAALQELSREGIIEVTWPKLRENIEVRKIYLNFEGVEQAYQLAGETPKEDKIRQLSLILTSLANHPWEWVRAWWEEIHSKLQERKPTGLDLDDLMGYEDLVQVLIALPELAESTPKRVFSQNIFHDSKHFEQKVERRLVSLLRKIYPEELEKDEDYLDQVGIVDNPKLTLLSGPLVIKPDIDLSNFPGGIGLSEESVKELVIENIPARTILLIENLTTYHEIIRLPEILPPPILFIYTGGFPHKSTQKLFQKIADFLAENNFGNSSEHYTHTKAKPVEAIYHWGDIDYGGIRIFEYLKQNFFPSLKPYRMDAATYHEYVESGLPFGEEQASKLERLLSELGYANWHPVIEEVLKYRKRVEQESIRKV